MYTARDLDHDVAQIIQDLGIQEHPGDPGLFENERQYLRAKLLGAYRAGQQAVILQNAVLAVGKPLKIEDPV